MSQTQLQQLSLANLQEAMSQNNVKLKQSDATPVDAADD